MIVTISKRRSNYLYHLRRRPLVAVSVDSRPGRHSSALSGAPPHTTHVDRLRRSPSGTEVCPTDPSHRPAPVRRTTRAVNPHYRAQPVTPPPPCRAAPRGDRRPVCVRIGTPQVCASGVCFAWGSSVVQYICINVRRRGIDVL